MSCLRLPALLLVQGALLSGLFAQTPINRTLIRPEPDAARPGGPFVEAFARARKAVVHVIVQVDGPTPFEIQRPGSGVVVGRVGLILTHWSLVREAEGAADKTVFVQLAEGGGARLPAIPVAHDERTGLALLRAELPDGVELPALPLAVDPAPGDPVAVLGFHDGEDLVGFAGVASPAVAGVALGEGPDRRELLRDEILLTDAAIQRRNHGAAVVNRAGELVGLCNAELVREELQEPTLEDLKRPGFGFIIPASTIRKVCPHDVGAPAPQSGPSAAARAYATAMDAVVGVFGGGGTRPEPGWRDPYAKQRRRGVGSGVVVDSGGLVLTNLHLIGDGADVQVTFRSGASYGAEVLSRDARTNSALLRLRLPEGTEVPAPRRARADAIAVGDPVLAIGNPEGHTPVVGAGVLSARRGGRLQTDAPSGNHNGGGALISLRGELLGMLDAGARDRIEVAFARRGDRAKVDTSLNFAPSLDALIDAHRTAFERHATDALAAAAETTPSSIARIVERSAGSMLNVYIEITSAPAQIEDNPFATPQPHTIVESLGSGVIVDPSGLALTNWHVVDSATEPDGSMRPDHVVRVALRSGRVFPAKVLSISREEDLALLQLELSPGEALDAVRLGSSAALAVGDTAIAIGNPHGRANTVTVGVITAKNQAIRVRGRWARLPHLLETDAAINAGNSGGALLDSRGRLIGINSAGGSLFSVTGYAISVDHVREKLQSVLLSPEKLRSPYLGVMVTDRDDTVVIHSVDPFGPAAGAGIERGDLLRSIGGEPVRWSIGFAITVLGVEPGTPVDLELERDGGSIVAAVTPWSAPAWAVFRQTGLVCSELSVREAPQTVHDASVAFYRAFTGVPTAAPALIPGSLVRVDGRHPRLDEDEVDIQAGDIVLGVKIDERQATGDAGRILRFGTIADLQRCFNHNSSYEGRSFQTWIRRGEEILVVDLPAKRLIL